VFDEYARIGVAEVAADRRVRVKIGANEDRQSTSVFVLATASR